MNNLKGGQADRGGKYLKNLNLNFKIFEKNLN